MLRDLDHRMCIAGIEIFNLTNLFHLWQHPSATGSETFPKISHTFPGKIWFCLQDTNHASWCLFTWQPSQCLTPNLHTQWQSNPRRLARMFSYWAQSCQKRCLLWNIRYRQASAKPSVVYLTTVATRGGIRLLRLREVMQLVQALEPGTVWYHRPQR